MNNKVYVRCPECGCVSDSIKHYEMPDYVLFLLVYVMGRTVKYTCCPRCMRTHILVKCFTYNILLANVLWPFTILPWGIVLFLCSFISGHSSEVEEYIYTDSTGDDNNE